MAKGVKTVSRDLGENRIKKQIAELKRSSKGPHVKVGFLESSGDHDNGDGLTVAEVAFFNEFGTSRIPERAFMRTTAKAIQPKMEALGRKLLSEYIAGKITLDEALDQMGLTVQSAIKISIREWTSPPNAESTILAKARSSGRKKITAEIGRRMKKGEGAEQASAAALSGYNNPLEDTGQMRNSVDYVKVK